MKNIAIVTGASSGIGKEFFLSLEDKKNELDEIWVVARNEEKLTQLQSLTSTPLQIFPLDLSQPSSIDVLKNALQEQSPCVRYLICASGFGRFCAVEEDNAETLQNMVDLNCRSIVGLTTAAQPYMQKDSVALLIASVAAFQPIPYIATYAATKSFVLSYGRGWNVELKKSCGARCVCVCPFWTKTAFFERAVTEKQVVKKYVAMYEPKQIVKKAWKDVKKKGKDVSLYGFKAKSQTLLVKLLPHKLVMKVWLGQQKLK